MDLFFLRKQKTLIVQSMAGLLACSAFFPSRLLSGL